MKSVLLALAMLSHVAMAAPADSIAPDATKMSTAVAVDFAKGIRAGWNVGNSLEALGSGNVPCETCWGNPAITQTLIDSVKAAGFNAIRLPVAWSKFTGDTSKFVIDTNWLARVQKVVDYAIGRDLYVLMNEHWDGGWLQPTAADSAYANRRLRAIWKQVAIRFRDYGDHLLFAGTNEVMKTNDYGTPTQEYVNVQNGFNQIFVKTVRATGGRNSYRYLVVQAFNTNIEHGVSFLKLPTDPATKRLMVEVHYYDPYDFTINEGNTTITQWGATAAAAKKATWGDESYVDGEFAKLKSTFVDKGYPVVVGEYGTIAKAGGDNAAFRVLWTQYVTKAAVKIGALPFYWDNGVVGSLGMGIFDRSTGAQAYPALVKAVVGSVPSGVAIRELPAARGPRRVGEDLVGPGPIHLLDARGRLERRSSGPAGVQKLSMAGLPSGIHLAVSAEGRSTVVVP